MPPGCARRGRTGEVEAFLEADAAFHRAVGRALGAMSSSRPSTRSSPRSSPGAPRRACGRSTRTPMRAQWHFDVADAIGSQRPQRAREAMAKIVAKAYDEMSSVWEGEPRRP